MTAATTIPCTVDVKDSDVRSPHSFRRSLRATFRFGDDGGEFSVEGTILRTLDGFAVESVDRDDLNVDAEQKAELLLAIQAEVGFGRKCDPQVGRSSTDFDVSVGGSTVLNRRLDQLVNADWA
jgi:hypothetical protein